MKFFLASFSYFRTLFIILMVSAALFVVAAFLNGESFVFFLFLSIAAALLSAFFVNLLGEMKLREKESIQSFTAQSGDVLRLFGPCYDKYVELANKNLQSQVIEINDIKEFKDQIDSILNELSRIKYNHSSLVYLINKKTLIIKELYDLSVKLTGKYLDLNIQESVPIMKTMVDLLLKLELEIELFNSAMNQRISVLNEG